MRESPDVNGDAMPDAGVGVDNTAAANIDGDFSDGAGFDLNGENSGCIDSNEISDEDVGENLNNGDAERLNFALDNFQEDKWGDLSLEDQKQAMAGLADCVADITGNENPPEIIFRDDMADCEYGGYNTDSNTLEINVNMIGDSVETADTVAHEMWHAYQHQCALDSANERSREYQEGFDNYIRPEYDFEGYENQMVEMEARTFAQGFRDRLARMRGVA